MKNWMSGGRGMALMVLLWVIGWALGFGGLAEIFVDPSGETLDIWPAELAIPGFFAGIIFAVLVRITEGRRSFAQVPYVRFTALGIAATLAIAVLTITTDGPIPLSLTDRQMMGLATALGSVSGFGTALFCRMVTQGPLTALSWRTG